MWNSAPFLSAIGSWSIIIALVATLVAAVVGTVGTIASNRAADIDKGKANVRIAEANARAEEARLAALKLRERFAWRRLVGERKGALVTALQGFNKEVWIERVKTDPETMNFAAELDEAFVQASVKTYFFQGWTRASGLQLHGDNPEDLKRIATAFAAAGIKFDAIGPKEQGQHGDIRILVGSKMDGLYVSNEPAL